MAYAVEGLDGDRVRPAPSGLTPYSWRGPCRVDGCTNPATDPHHIIPRGRLGGDVRWVMVDGRVVGNVAGLCRRHHDKITRGDSVLLWRDLSRSSGWWYRSQQRCVCLRPLGSADACVHVGRGCPHCGQPMPRPRPFDMTRRDRRPFVVAAPVDQGEDGPQILDSLAQGIAERLGMENPGGDSARYHAVLTALAAVTTNPSALDGLIERMG